MNIKTIIARFLPLLDVTVVLLGLIIILMAYAHFEEQSSQASDSASDSLAAFAPDSSEAPIRFVYLYADPDGSCYRFNPNTKKPEKRIATDNDKDIRLILQERPNDATWLFLVFRSNDEHWGEWPQSKIDSLRKEWNLEPHQKLFELFDVPFGTRGYRR